MFVTGTPVGHLSVSPNGGDTKVVKVVSDVVRLMVANPLRVMVCTVEVVKVGKNSTVEVKVTYVEDTESRRKTSEHGSLSSKDGDGTPIYRNVGESVILKHGMGSGLSTPGKEKGHIPYVHIDEIRLSP